MSPFDRQSGGATPRLAAAQPQWAGSSNCEAKHERIGAPIFVDELERFAAEVSDPRCAAIAKRLAAPLRVAVSGRPGVGRGTVAHALARAGDLRGTIALTSTSTHADVNVYVLAEVVKPEDRDAIGAIDRPVLAVLNKADLIATTESGRHPDGPTTAARTRCARLSARAGIPIEPFVGVLAVAALDDQVDDTLWAALQDLANGHPVAPLHRRLVDTLDMFGLTQALAAIGRGANRAETATLLRGLSCIDEVVGKIGVLGAQVYYQRLLDAAAELETLAVTDRRVGEFLSRDDTVVARMMAAVDVVEAVGMNVDHTDTAAAHLRRALDWHRYRRGPVAGPHRACGADIVRGSLRLWTKVGGAV
jgi:hypothetical protein